MTEEEIKNLEIRKALNREEYERLTEIASDFEYLLDGEKDTFLKDLYYEHLLTQYEIESIKSKKDEYSKKLVEELENYRSVLTNMAYKNRCDITKTLEK